MRILQLTKKVPYPINDGEVIAITNLAKAFHKANCEVTLLAMNTPKHSISIESIPSSFNFYKKIYTVEVNTDLNPVDAFANLFSKKSYHIQRFDSREYHLKLEEILTENQFDIIQLETLYLAPYVPTVRTFSQAKIVMRAHNVETEIWERNAQIDPSWIKGKYLSYLSKKLKNFEKEFINQYDLLLSITSRDLVAFKKLGLTKAARVVPIGINGEEYKPEDSSYKNKLSLSFIGSLDWMPNYEGIQWMLKTVWPDLILQFPELQLHVGGRNTPQDLKDSAIAGVVFHGEVPDAKDFINEHSIMIVPLFSGSGMRAKILEGMALGKVVITTSIGLEGIDAKDRKEVLIADNKREFLQAIQYCYDQKEALLQIGQAARKFIQSRYDNYQISNELLKTYESLIE